MDLGLPAGVRDFLPGDAARLTELAGRLSAVFASHGYRRVVVPTLERADVVARGLGAAAAARLFRAVEPGTGEVVAVSPDHTAQVGRMWASGLFALPPPVRVSYVGPVMRALEHGAGRPREVFQAGVECLGAAGVEADAEIVQLVCRALTATGLERFTVDLGHAGFVNAFLDAAELPLEAREAARGFLGRKDRASLEAALGPMGRGAAARARRAIPELAGLWAEGTLTRARRLARRAGVDDGALDEIEKVRALMDPGAEVTVDLGETRGHGYYTGVTVHAYAPGAGGEVASGGRYDDLLGRYGRPAPAVGAAFDLAFLLEATQGSATQPTGLVMATGKRPLQEALQLAAQLREAGHAVALLPGATKKAALAHARAHAHREVIVPAKKGWLRIEAATGSPAGSADTLLTGGSQHQAG